MVVTKTSAEHQIRKPSYHERQTNKNPKPNSPRQRKTTPGQGGAAGSAAPAVQAGWNYHDAVDYIGGQPTPA